MSLKLIILGKAGLQVLTDIFKVNQYFKKKKNDHSIWSHHFMQIDGEKVGRVKGVILGASKIMVTAAMKLKNACSLDEKL